MQWLTKLFFRRKTGRIRKSRHRHKASSSEVQTLENRLLLTLNITYNYSLDSSRFFNDQSRRDVLEEVATIFESRITDDLTAITPGGLNTWIAEFSSPSTGTPVALNNLTIPEDTIIVYAGARDLPSGLALGGSGGFQSSGSPAFNTALQTRGESGVDVAGNTDTDFSLWGGAISFDSQVAWNFSLNPPNAGQNDFFSVALHEIGHVLGLGTANSFRNQINGSNQFTGQEAVTSFGAPVPMNSDAFGNPDHGHWASDTMSTLPGTTTSQEAALDPQITTGLRKVFTNLDWAGLNDLGWDVTAVSAPLDYGDAPDALAGVAAGNYNTRTTDSGPSHQIVTGLRIGNSVDSDDGNLQNSDATADDALGVSDEDGLTLPLTIIEGVTPTVSVNVTNTTGRTGTLFGWIDFNQNGVFENQTEMATVIVGGQTNNAAVQLVFPEVPQNTAGITFSRFRLSTDVGLTGPTGTVSDGEVEDHQVTILAEQTAYDSLPSFNWPPITGAVRYELEVNNVTTGQTQVLHQTHLTTTSFRPHWAMPAATYSWRYRPYNSTGALPWSALVSFAIFEKSGQPIITDPVTLSVDSLPTIAWSPIVDAEHYELWVNGTNHSRVIHQPKLTATSFTPATGLAPGNYTAWVRPYFATSVGTWSLAHSINLLNSTTSVLTDPVAGTTNTIPTFAWLPMNVSSYQLRVDNISTGATNVILQQNLTGTSFTAHEALPPGNYRAWITGHGTADSAPVDFQVLIGNAQTRFSVPFGNSENPLPVFGWTAVTGATRYELWVDNVTSGVARVIHSSSITNTSFAAQTPLAPATYRAWARAFSGSTPLATWSPSIDVRVTEASGVPTIWAPVDGSQNTVPTFVWSSVLGATSYELDVSQGGQLMHSQQSIGTNHLQLEALLPPGTYQSTVRARSGATLLGTSQRTFTVTLSTGPIELFSPDATTNRTRPAFSWTPIATATRYFVWVNDKTRNVNATLLENNVQDTMMIPDSPVLPGDYQVWVRAFNGSIPVGNWSTGVRFTVTESAAPPSVTAPTPNTTNSVPAITWTAVAGTATYEIEIDDVTNSQTAFITAQGLSTTVYRPASPLLPGAYAVRVRSVDSGGTVSAWSTDFSMTIATAIDAELVIPLVKSATATANILFAWTSVTNAVAYELWVNNVTTGTNRIINETALPGISFTPVTQLAPGTYRAWVSAIGPGNVPGVWSSGVDFVVTV
ncbi:MAG: GEVED domain-containing protein [Fuerstiella sp.]